MVKMKNVVPIDRIILLIPWSLVGSACRVEFKYYYRYMYLDSIDDKYNLGLADFYRNCAYISSDEKGRVTPFKPPPLSGGLVWEACRVVDKDGSIYEEMSAVRVGVGDQDPIVYTLTLKTTPAVYTIDHAAFMRWVQSIRFAPIS